MPGKGVAILGNEEGFGVVRWATASARHGSKAGNTSGTLTLCKRGETEPPLALWFDGLLATPKQLPET